MSLSERIHQLNSEIGASVERALAELRQEISQRLRASNDEIQRRLEDFTPSLPPSYLSHDDLAPAAERELGPGARRGAVRALRDAIAGIDRARSQADILSALLREAAHYASRVAVLLVRGNELRGWGGEGFGDAALRDLTLEAQDGAWGRLAQAQGAILLSASDCAALCSRIESPLPSEGVLVPILLRDRVAAGLYADRLDGAELGVEALQVLAHAAAQAIETLPFRERSSTPTLALDGGIDGGGAPAAVAEIAEEPAAAAAVEAPAPAEAAAPATPEPEPRQEALTPPEPVPAYAAPEPEAPAWAAPAEEAPEAPPVEAPPRVTGESVAWDAATARVTEAMPLPGFPRTSEGLLSTQREPAPPMEEEVPRFPRSVEPEPVRAPDPSPDATVLLPRSNLVPEPPPAPSPLRPVPPPEEPALDRGTPEVRPPSGVEGPGWAFATTRVPVSADNQALHEEARRLARLLVSEIKLYNEEQVEEGRRNRDIYERLREDI
ncbi:MAG: hypothetical protein DMF53_17995, partial [Acidobacteria bacterium]